MGRRGWLLLALGALLGANPGTTAPSADLERNRRELEQLRADPERYRRLQHDLRAFWALPAREQEKLRRLDKQFHEGDEAAQARRWSALARYTTWLEGLSEADRLRVLSTSHPEVRLAVIREIRDRQWVEKLPAKSPLRQELLPLAPAELAARVAQERKKERERRVAVLRGPMPPAYPRTMKEFPPEVVAFVEKHVKPHLGESERERLARAEGKPWPMLVNTVRQLADNHPVLPPALGRREVRRFWDLPQPYQHALSPFTKFSGGKGFKSIKALTEQLKDLQRREGRWPEYALRVVEICDPPKKKGGPMRLLPPLGASRPDEFSPEVRAFIEKRLLPSLSVAELNDLRQKEGRWPLYPRHLHSLVREKELVIPDLSLPGPPELWASARAAP